jgi:hypothetical protein
VVKSSFGVLKLNDAIYYSSWKDYFYNLLLHNFFFEDTAYNLLGFTKDGDILYAVVQQTYVSITHITDLTQVKVFMNSNGFKNTRSNDYFNPELGIILEDLHDENVLTRNDVLYFMIPYFILLMIFGQRNRTSYRFNQSLLHIGQTLHCFCHTPDPGPR